MNKKSYQLAKDLGRKLSSRQLSVTCAESCTGGMLSGAITDIAGSSAWFHAGFITYSNEVKQQMLGVDAGLIAKCGAVSQEVVLAMLSGALKRANADVGLAVSGVAGPGGGSDEKPIGTVCIAWGTPNHANAKTYIFKGDRAAVRTQTVCKALELALDLDITKSTV